MEFKGTKGKWYTIKTSSSILVTCDNPNWHICETISNQEIDKANAQLIASAPEMFEMLKELLTDIDELIIPTSMNDTIFRAKQLLTKITTL